VGVYTVTDPQVGGSVVTSNSASASDTFPVSDGETYIVLVTNGGGSPDTVVFDDPTSLSPQNALTFNPDVSVVVAAGTSQVFRIAASRFKNPSSGVVGVTHSFTTTVSVWVFRGGRV
jgi:hypothetical protein